MHGDAVMARRFHRHIDVNASPLPFRFCAVAIVMKTKIVHIGSLACDSHGLGDHALLIARPSSLVNTSPLTLATIAPRRFSRSIHREFQEPYRLTARAVRLPF